MPIEIFETAKQKKLRMEAEARIREGKAPSLLGWQISVETLRSLHELASNPAHAPDALKLLKELQVHQVALDLQYIESVRMERELSEDLAYYKDLFDSAPLGYFNISLEGNVLEANSAGVAMFGVDAAEMAALPLINFMTAESRPAFQALLTRLREGSPRELCESQAGGCDAKLLLLATPATDSKSFLVNVIDSSDCMKQKVSGLTH